MRNFLTNLNIVGCTNVWQEGNAVRYCLDNLLKWCNYIVVIMDNPDEVTKNIILNYQKTYPNIFRIGYSGLPAIKNFKRVRRREKSYRSQLVEAKLKLVKKIHKEERKVDILLTPDSDEIFTDYLPILLEKFWQSNKDSIFMKSMDVYDNIYLIHGKGLMSHVRAYKYQPDVFFTPTRQQTFYFPYKRSNAMLGVIAPYVHLSCLKEFNNLRKIIGDDNLAKRHPNIGLWKIEKSVQELMPEEYQKIIANKPDYILKDYEGIFN